ncbi:helix-turn-helix domain-containing protein [Cohnella soli]|uniref:Helix-turn-helix domain-containing protein n=1 Tax=Cohnella soli TaxID=425005 RepID=A0ABW0HWF9_9BACL
MVADLIADYINELRMKKAAMLLENSNMNVSDIIFQVGYENESYFYSKPVQAP